MKSIYFLAIFFVFYLLLGFSETTGEIGYDNSRFSYFRIDISSLNSLKLSELKKSRAISYWCQLEDTLLVTVKNEKVKSFLLKNDLKKEEIKTAEDLSEPLLALRKGLNSPLDNFKDEIKILYTHKGTTVFQARKEVVDKLNSKQSNHFRIETLKMNLPLLIKVNQLELKLPVFQKLPKPKVKKDRLADFIKTLEGFKTRYSTSEGFLKAAEFAVEEFEKAGLQAKIVEFTYFDQKMYNVIAQKSFETQQENFYIICAHLDSTSRPTPKVFAPGADDNGSGSAGVLESAILLSETDYIEKFRFVLFGGEEQGIIGSKVYTNSLIKTGEISKISGVVNFDMIGFDKNPPLHSLFETKQFADPFVGNFVAAAKENGKPEIEISYYAWGSDHVPFLNAKVPCFLFIEREFEENPNYHKDTDLFTAINMELVTETVRVTIMAFIKMLTPPNPVTIH